MSLGWVIVVAACAFCSGLAADQLADAKGHGFAEDAYVAGWLWFLFTFATVAMMALGVWVQR